MHCGGQHSVRACEGEPVGRPASQPASITYSWPQRAGMWSHQAIGQVAVLYALPDQLGQPISEDWGGGG